MNNLKVYYEIIVEEILKDLNNKVDVFICGIGIGGSFFGIVKKLKEKLFNIKIFFVEFVLFLLFLKGYIGFYKI